MFIIILNIIEIFLDSIYTFLIKRSFYSFGKNSKISFKCKITNPQSISIGSNVFIKKNVWLNAGPKNFSNKPFLVIEDGCQINTNTHINAYQNVQIKKFTLIGENVYFGDADHGTDDYSKPIIDQKIKIKAPVIIGSGTHICKNAILSSPIELGKNCLVAPNAYLIEKKLEDFSLAIGNPAVVIEDYNKKS